MKKKDCESGWVWWKQNHSELSEALQEYRDGRQPTTKNGKLGFAFVDKNNKVNVVPIISVDTKALIFQSDVTLITSHKKELEKEYTERTGIECIILDGRAKLAAVIDG